MPVVKCKGVNVEFPFDPYECQLDYMNKVIECLQTGKNGILESPTGTGKTLCLLCAALAWRNTYISQQELGRCLQGTEEGVKELKEGAGGGWGEGQEGMFLDRPRIIYASRTHSQLSQAVDQLKDTLYRPRVAVIGSRDQLCIHPEVQKTESNAAKVHMCRAKVDKRVCHFYNSLDQKKADKAFTDSILDIEDLVKLGNTHKVCPYYMARELKTNADIIFMPYNYLLDSKARRIHGVELQGNVVIFDEAHNVEKMCEESASFDLTSFDLASCVEETDQLLKKTVEVEMCNQEFRADSGGENEFDAAALATLKKLFLDLESAISDLNPPAESGLTKPGSFIYELFAKVHITLDTKVELLQLMEKIISHLTTSSTMFHNKAAGLQKFCDIINIVFNNVASGSQASKCYKVHVQVSAPQKKGRTDLWTSNNSASAKSKKQGYTLGYWCFSPGFSMKDLVSQGVRSIILTSGTLSPLNSFKSELQIDFPIQLENPHVIGTHQMTVAVLTKGPDGTVLNSSYSTRFNKDYVLSLGNAIVNFSRLVPNGLLVFFPSYTVMNHALEQWQESGIQQRISQYKEIFVEPKGKHDFVQTIEAFYEKINDPKLNGACFFAVCRGKVSEGLDFADINGRAVVITGLPFPPRFDARVKLKMQYLDEARRGKKESLSGQDWYRQQASRAVNQAIGRVIRHKEDFGAILLCDTRFSNREARNQLPSWVRPYVNIYDQFGKGIRDLTNFFKETEKTMPKPQPKQSRPSGPVLIDQAQRAQQSVAASVASAPPTKAKHVDAHVQSLKRNRDGSHVSEAQLKIMYEDSRPKPAKSAASLLSALSSVENISEDRDDNCLSQPSSQCSSQELGRPKRLDQQKKKKIVIKQQNRLDSTSKKGQGARPAQATNEGTKKKGGTSLASAQDYIAQVKRTLSHDSYKRFSSIMQEYKKTDDFSVMIGGIADLFTEDESKYPLFRNFYTFARPHHKEDFNKICLSLTGEGCGYKPEHSIRQKKLATQNAPRSEKTNSCLGEDKAKCCKSEQSCQQDKTTNKTGNPTKWTETNILNTGDASVAVNIAGLKNPASLLIPGQKGKEIPRKQDTGLERDSQKFPKEQFTNVKGNKTRVKADIHVSNQESHSKDTIQNSELEARQQITIKKEQGDCHKNLICGNKVLKKGSSAGVDHSGKAGVSVTDLQKSFDTTVEEKHRDVKSNHDRCQEKPKGNKKAVDQFPQNVANLENPLATIRSEPSCSLEKGPRLKLNPNKNVKDDDEHRVKGEILKMKAEEISSECRDAESSNLNTKDISIKHLASVGKKTLSQDFQRTETFTEVKKDTFVEDHRQCLEDEGNDFKEDSEEPMSLESAPEELDASGELFDEDSGPLNPFAAQKDVICANKPMTELDKNCTPHTESTRAASSAKFDGSGQVCQADTSAKANSSESCFQQDSVIKGPQRSRAHKLVNHVKSTISKTHPPKEDTTKFSGKVNTSSKAVKTDMLNNSSRLPSEELFSPSHAMQSSEKLQTEVDFCSSLLLTRTIKTTDEPLRSEIPKTSGQFVETSSITKQSEANKDTENEARKAMQTEETRVNSLPPEKIRKHLSNKTVSPGKKEDGHCDGASKFPSSSPKDTPSKSHPRKKSKTLDSLRVKEKTSKIKKVPKKLTNSSPETVSRKRRIEDTREMSLKKKHKANGVDSASKELGDECVKKEPAKIKETSTKKDSNSDDTRTKKYGTPLKTEKSSAMIHNLVGLQDSDDDPKETKSTSKNLTEKGHSTKLEQNRKKSNPKTPKKNTMKSGDIKDKRYCDAATDLFQKGKSSTRHQNQGVESQKIPKQSSKTSEIEDKPKRNDTECGFCKKTAWPALRGLCGHICCEMCWKAYIKEFHECPKCGTRMEEEQLIAV